MAAARFEFSLSAIDLCRLDGIPSMVDGYVHPQLPTDFAEVVDGKGDRFRDAFTRACLYLANRHIDGSRIAAATVVVGTEYGNLEAMLRFQRQALAADKTISAQQFPHATTSSASTFVNIDKKLTGGNATLNAGALTPVTALLHALLHIQAHTTGRSHVFVGDAYCAEAVDDVRKQAGPIRRITPGVCYAALSSGANFQAEVSFGDAAFDLCGGGDSRVCGADPGDEHNGAFALHWLLSSAQALAVGGCASLGIQAADRRAAVRLTRLMSV